VRCHQGTGRRFALGSRKHRAAARRAPLLGRRGLSLCVESRGLSDELEALWVEGHVCAHVHDEGAWDRCMRPVQDPVIVVVAGVQGGMRKTKNEWEGPCFCYILLLLHYC
jgi:hypothetical protein